MKKTTVLFGLSFKTHPIYALHQNHSSFKRTRGTKNNFETETNIYQITCLFKFLDREYENFNMGKLMF